MEINLNNKMKELRKARGNTQEDLADYLGVTVQAVSKWERGEGMPDITFLPMISSFYSVTVDELLGVVDVQKEARINELRAEYERILCTERDEKNTVFINPNTTKAAVDHLRSALREFPDNRIFQDSLASTLLLYSKTCSDSEEKIKILDESGALCRSIIKYCADDRLRDSANYTLCRVLCEQGNKQQAEKIANEMPSFVHSRENMLAGVLEGKELEEHLSRTISNFLVFIFCYIKQFKMNNFDPGILQKDTSVKHCLDDIMSEIYAK